jgi:hypothetical protein
MATIIINHRVKDFHQWKSYYDADVKRRDAAGLQEISVGRMKEDPNNIYMIWESSNPEAAKRMAEDPELKALMEKAGVISEPEMIILE